ncbi:unnamed protein product, partial [Choristocarpus tenellus]
FPGAKNDKTIIRYDGAIQKLRNDPTYRQLEYNVNASFGNGYTEKGAYVLVDGGYPKWRCTICLLRASVTQAQARWSKRVESVRKDIECFFGRVKGGFSILELPLLYSERKNIDNIFFTCYILQNMLHS